MIILVVLVLSCIIGILLYKGGKDAEWKEIGRLVAAAGFFALAFFFAGRIVL